MSEEVRVQCLIIYDTADNISKLASRRSLRRYKIVVKIWRMWKEGKQKRKYSEKEKSKNGKLKNNQMSEGRNYYEQRNRLVSMNERMYRMAKKGRKLECADVQEHQRVK